MVWDVISQRQRFYRGSLALRVLILSVVVIAFPLMVYFVFIYQQQYASRLADIAIRLHDLGSSRAQFLSQKNRFDLHVIDIVQQVMYDQALYHAHNAPQFSRFLTDVATGAELASVYYISLEPGSEFICTAASDPELIGQDFSSDRYVEDVLVRGRTSFLAHGASLSPGTDSFIQYFYVAKLLYDRVNHRRQGILTVSTVADDLIKRLVAPERSPYSVSFSLVTKEGIIFASSDPRLVLQVIRVAGNVDTKGAGTERYVDEGLIMKPIETIPGSTYLSWGGRERIGVEVPIEGTLLSLLLTADEKTVFAQQRSQLWRVLGVFILIFAVGAWIALWLTLRMSRPWQHLCHVMGRVSQGDLTARYHKRQAGFEINIIGSIFNQTIDSLREQMARAESERVQKETLDQEFRIGRDIQMSILPVAPPAYPGVKLAARYVPARQVGGDFYDIFLLEKSNHASPDLVLTVADASGKGISACLYSLLLRSMLRSFAAVEETISEAMRRANNLFCEDTGASGMFVTVLTLVLHADTKKMSFTSCGHTPALIRRQDGVLEALVGKGLAMGVMPFGSLEHDTIQLNSGDLVVMYSDGITEAHNENNELFGDRRLAEYLAREGHKSLDEVADGLLDAVAVFRSQAPVFDDITLLMMRLE